jgi:deazaflavin-dependent oxidoreductase (nitroreductase family)
MDATTTPRARTLALQGTVNRLMRGLLRMPLICRVVGRRLLTLYVIGRTSGRRYVIPVAYTRHDGALLVGTPFGWGRNLRTGEPVEVRLRGKRRRADVEVFADETGEVECYAAMARDNHQFARFNQINFDPAGEPDPDDLRAAWATGARAFRLTVR